MTKLPAYKSCVPKDALTSLDHINTVIVASSSLSELVNAVLDEVLEVFDCHRAWVMHPCDPDKEEVWMFAERCSPGFVGGVTPGEAFPPDKTQKAFLELCLSSPVPAAFAPEGENRELWNAELMESIGVRSQVAMALRPQNKSAWLLGIHHCYEARDYAQAMPLFNAIGKRLGSGLTTLMASEELRQSEQRFRAMVDYATEGIIILDCDNLRCIEANPAAERLYGYPRDQLIGPFRPGGYAPEFQPDGRYSADLSRQYIKQALAGEILHYEWIYQRADGSTGPAQVSMARFPDSTRNLVRVSVVDVSDLKRAEETRSYLESQLAQAQKLESIGQMSGGVAHDFNNLLSVVLGNLELLQDEIDDADQQELIRAAIQATYRGADLTRKMLSFARRAPLNPKVMDLSEILRDASNWMSRVLPANIDLRESLETGLWQIEADHASTESAILNLIINARDAMPEGGILTIEAANHVVDVDIKAPGRGHLAPGAYVMLAVSDTGVGISAAQLDKVFEPFFTTKKIGEGSGLGLSMVHGFMKQSGGAVRIYSEPGKGTTVKLFFQTPHETEDLPAESPQEPLIRPVSASRILFAEDEPDVASILTRILRSAGYEVVLAPTGDAAAEIFASDGPFDLLVTDIVMPGVLQGPGLARALREVQSCLPVVFMSGYAREAALHGNGLHENDIRLMKPVARSDLLAAVQKALSEI